MKQYLQFLFFFFITFQVHSQTISKQVIGSAGKVLSNTSNTVNFTVGETIVGTIQNQQTLYQGFWSEILNENVLTVETSTVEELGISVFPNPAVDILQVRFNSDETNKYKIQLYDINGREIFKLNYITIENTTRLNISHLSDGLYLLVISDNKNSFNKSYKIIKK